MSKLKVCLHNDSIEIIGTKRKFTYINTHINANGNLVKITANKEIDNGLLTFEILNPNKEWKTLYSLEDELIKRDVDSVISKIALYLRNAFDIPREDILEWKARYQEEI